MAARGGSGEGSDSRAPAAPQPSGIASRQLLYPGKRLVVFHGPVLKRSRVLRVWNNRYMVLCLDWHKGFLLEYYRWDASSALPGDQRGMGGSHCWSDTPTAQRRLDPRCLGERRGEIRLSGYMRVEASDARAMAWKIIDDSKVFEGIRLAAEQQAWRDAWVRVLGRAVGQQPPLDLLDLPAPRQGSTVVPTVAPRAHKTLSPPLARSRAGEPEEDRTRRQSHSMLERSASQRWHSKPGFLFVRVLRGRAMGALTSHPTAEPFVVLSCGKWRLRSRVSRTGASQAPSWSETLALPCSGSTQRFITLEVWDQDAKRSPGEGPKFLGRAVLAQARLSRRTQVLWLPLAGRSARESAGAEFGAVTRTPTEDQAHAQGPPLPQRPALQIMAWCTAQPQHWMQEVFRSVSALPVMRLGSAWPLFGVRTQLPTLPLTEAAYVSGLVRRDRLAGEDGALAGGLVGESVEDVATVILRPFTDAKGGVFPGTLILTNFRIMFIPSTVTSDTMRQVRGLHSAYTSAAGVAVGGGGAAQPALHAVPRPRAVGPPLSFGADSHRTFVTVDNRSGFQDHGATMAFQIPLALIRRVEMKHNREFEGVEADASGLPGPHMQEHALSAAFSMGSPEEEISLEWQSTSEHGSALRRGGRAASAAASRPSRQHTTPHAYMARRGSDSASDSSHGNSTTARTKRPSAIHAQAIGSARASAPALVSVASSDDLTQGSGGHSPTRQGREEGGEGGAGSSTLDGVAWSRADTDRSAVREASKLGEQADSLALEVTTDGGTVGPGRSSLLQPGAASARHVPQAAASPVAQAEVQDSPDADGPSHVSRVENGPLPTLKLVCDHFCTPRFIFQGDGPAAAHAGALLPEALMPDARHLAKPQAVCSRIFRRLSYAQAVAVEHEELLQQDAVLSLTAKQARGPSLSLPCSPAAGTASVDGADDALPDLSGEPFTGVSAEGSGPLGSPPSSCRQERPVPDFVVASLSSNVWNPSTEAARQCVSPAYWSMTGLNSKFKLCDSYPPFLLVPASLDASTVKGCAEFRSRGRLPALTWHHPGNGATIVRSAQPLVGLRGSRSPDDEAMLDAIRLACPRPNSRLIILDARPKLNAQANAVQGKGFEACGPKGAYANARIAFMNVENIHVMRRSLDALHAMLSRVPEAVLTNAAVSSNAGASSEAGVPQQLSSSIRAHRTAAKPLAQQVSAAAAAGKTRTVSSVAELTAEMQIGHDDSRQVASEGHSEDGHSDDVSSPRTPREDSSSKQGEGSKQGSGWWKWGRHRKRGGSAGATGTDFTPKRCHRAGSDSSLGRAAHPPLPKVHVEPASSAEDSLTAPGAEHALHPPLTAPKGEAGALGATASSTRSRTASYVTLVYDVAALRQAAEQTAAVPEQASGSANVVTSPSARKRSASEHTTRSALSSVTRSVSDALAGRGWGGASKPQPDSRPTAPSPQASTRTEGSIGTVRFRSSSKATGYTQAVPASLPPSATSSPRLGPSGAALLRGFPSGAEQAPPNPDSILGSSSSSDEEGDTSRGALRTLRAGDSEGAASSSLRRKHSMSRRSRSDDAADGDSSESEVGGGGKRLMRKHARRATIFSAQQGIGMRGLLQAATAGAMSPALPPQEGSASEDQTPPRGSPGVSFAPDSAPAMPDLELGACAAQDADQGSGLDGGEATLRRSSSMSEALPSSSCVVLGPSVASGRSAAHLGAGAIQDLRDAATAAILAYTGLGSQAGSSQGSLIESEAGRLLNRMSPAAKSMAEALSPAALDDAAAVAAVGDAWSSSLSSLAGRVTVSLGLLGNDEMWLHTMESSGWLRHISLVLAASIRLARLVDECGYSVLVHCSDGWDRTTQIVCLAQILLDPYYRTMEGFAVLVEKDWCAFGHKLQDRGGRGRGGRGSQEVSPVFLQFLDAVQQLVVQSPSAFEFSPSFLSAIAIHSSSGWFGTLQWNSPQQRFLSKLDAAHSILATGPQGYPAPGTAEYWSAIVDAADQLPCLWRHLWQHRGMFMNPAYSPVHPAVLRPMPIPEGTHTVYTSGSLASQQEGLRRIWQRAQVLQPQHSPRALHLWGEHMTHWGARVHAALSLDAQWVLQSLAYVPDEDVEEGGQEATSLSGSVAPPSHTSIHDKAGLGAAALRKSQAPIKSGQAQLVRRMGRSRKSMKPTGLQGLLVRE